MAWLLSLLLVAPAPAPAGRAELELSWDAPPHCPTRDAVLERVESSLARPLREADGPSVRVEARVDGEEGALTLLLRTQTADGVGDRELSGSTCEILADAAVLMIAAALDPSLAFGGEPEPELEPPEPEPEPGPSEPESEPPELACRDHGDELGEPPEPVSELAGVVRAAGTGSVGPLPSITPGIEVAAGVMRRRVRVELGLDYFFARRVAANELQGGEIQLWTVSTRACFVPAVSILELPVCGGVQAGPMRGEGYGLETPTSTRLPWVAAELGGALVIRGLPLVDVFIGADLVMPMTRPGFFIDDLGLVHRSGLLGAEATAGIEVRFGPGRRHPYNG